MKKISCLFFLALIICTAYTQNFPPTYFKDSHTEKRPTSLAFHENSTILSCEVHLAWNNLYPVLMKISDNQVDTIPVFRDCFLSSVVETIVENQYFYFIGKTQANPGDTVKIFIVKTDQLLNIQNIVLITPSQNDLVYLKTVTQFPFIKIWYVANSGFQANQKSIYTMEYNMVNGVTSNYQQAPLFSNFIYFSGISSLPDSAGWAVNGIYTSTNGEMIPGCFMFNDSLTYERFWIYPPTEVFGFQQYGIVLYSNTHFINSSTAYVSARAYLADTVIGYPQNYRYYMKTMLADTTGNVYNSNVFGAGDTTLYPAFFKHLVPTEDNHFYVVWTKNIEAGCIPYCQRDSYIGVTYLNDSLEIEWERFFGGDAFYTSHIAEPAPGGGIVIAGTRYRYNDPGQPHEVILLSVTDEGIITGTAGNLPVEGRQAIVYPNPGDASLFVQTGRHLGQAEFTLYDINGRHLLTKALNTHVTQIDTGFLPAGTYIYTIQNEKFSESGKWVKR